MLRMRLLKDGERMEFNVKENKCFKPALALKYKGAQTATVPGDDFEYMTFYDDAITSDSVAVISIVHADSSTIDDITVSHVVTEGGVQVRIRNAGASEASVTVNVAVL